MNVNQKAILRSLLYFDIFGHPLSRSELFELNGTSAPPEEFDLDIEELLSDRIIGYDAGYFFLDNGGTKISERLDKLERSAKYYKIAHVVSRFIFSYPFVRAVMVTGSLSKKSSGRKDDIDFFVITEPGRLWLCRTILMFFKKLFLFNSKKYFCVNYFIDSAHLEIPERNIFTATELAFLRPMCNPHLFRQMMEANAWMKSYYPNWTIHIEGCADKRDSFLKRSLEKGFNGKIGDYLDTVFLKIYKKRAERKFGNTDKNLFSLNFKSEKHVSKHHPSGFQHRVMNNYEVKIAEFEMKHKVNLTI